MSSSEWPRGCRDLSADSGELLESVRGTWLVTGAAGFIGSNLVEALLKGGQRVVGLDNFATGHRDNLAELQSLLPGHYKEQFRLIEADVRDREACEKAVDGVDYVLHQAALGSVPRSIKDPLTSHDVNSTGFLNMLDAARRAGVKRFVYASSSSTYGDNAELPKREDRIGEPLSPYAATKRSNEVYAAVYANSYGFKSVGLRYFNVFGPRQDPNGPYAAVIPKWTAAMINNELVTIFGDGQTSRDFCYITNAVQANLLAALAADDAQGQIYNVAVGDRTTLLELFDLVRDTLAKHQVHYTRPPKMEDFRKGDVRHSMADISRARELIDYEPTHSVAQGLAQAMPWYLDYLRSKPS